MKITSKLIFLSALADICSCFNNKLTFGSRVIQTLTFLLELGGMTKNLYHGIFLNYTGFMVYDGIIFFHA